MSPQITLHLPLESVNLILQALAKQPYEVVAGLIPQIQVATQSQLDALKQPPAPAAPAPADAAA